MPFEIFVIPGIVFGLYGFYLGLREANVYKLRSNKSNEQ